MVAGDKKNEKKKRPLKESDCGLCSFSLFFACMCGYYFFFFVPDSPPGKVALHLIVFNELGGTKRPLPLFVSVLFAF
ncbi:hypothetical protein TRSC58_07682 [Trypanosoma rangeli SC58]|uniref:Uncharacterized protein n=1 Tax=Trypanosoma rangeli SC58 TaxID=429131 RepID=A0A061ISP7_TRYRA|nr:hypothetical protein TRSC58_07682 [Trypanosoma rangeli SC58]